MSLTIHINTNAHTGADPAEKPDITAVEKKPSKQRRHIPKRPKPDTKATPDPKKGDAKDAPDPKKGAAKATPEKEPPQKGSKRSGP